MFSDDKTVETRYKVCRLLESVLELQENVDAIDVWCEQSGLTMNDSKCKFMVFDTPSFFNNPIPDFVLVKIGDQVLRPSSDVKQLGVWLNHSLGWGK